MGSQWMLTGYQPTIEVNDNIYPSTGSVVAKMRGPNAPGMPPYVNLPRALSLGKAAYLGASYNGTRLNRLVSPSVTIDGAVALLTPIIKRYALEREVGEGFGDYCDRVILPADATFHSVGTVSSEVAAVVG